jgi:hypothetical protein
MTPRQVRRWEEYFGLKAELEKKAGLQATAESGLTMGGSRRR